MACALFGIAVLQLLLQTDSVNEALRWILENYQLVGNDSVDYLLLLRLVGVVDVARFVELSLASAVTLVALQHLVDAHCFFAAWVFVLATEGSGTHLDLGS